MKCGSVDTEEVVEIGWDGLGGREEEHRFTSLVSKRKCTRPISARLNRRHPEYHHPCTHAHGRYLLHHALHLFLLLNLFLPLLFLLLLLVLMLVVVEMVASLHDVVGG